MATPTVRLAVALDGGTTNTRARLLKGGEVVRTARRSVGVRDRVLGENPASLADAVRQVIAEVLDGEPHPPDLVVAAGMLTADVGLLPVPHAPAPAGIEELASAAVEKRLPEVYDRPILFIPGVKTPPAAGPDGWTRADVMRGEECETIGAMIELASGEPSQYFWPGSHSKYVNVDESDRIRFSVTTLAGELTAALAGHTLLAASLPSTLPDDPDLDAVRLGMSCCKSYGLGRVAFQVRLGQLLGTLPTPDVRAAFLIGAVIGNDLETLALDPRMDRARPLYVGGRQPQRRLYADGFARLGFARVIELPDSLVERCSATGAIAIAARRPASN